MELEKKYNLTHEENKHVKDEIVSSVISKSCTVYALSFLNKNALPFISLIIFCEPGLAHFLRVDNIPQSLGGD